MREEQTINSYRKGKENNLAHSKYENGSGTNCEKRSEQSK
jgi:hypothetical protein